MNDLTEALISVYTRQIRKFSFHATRPKARLLLDRLELLDAESNKDVARRQRAADAANICAYREQAQMIASREQAIIQLSQFIEN